MGSNGKYNLYDSHTLYVVTHNFDATQVRQSIHRSASELSKECKDSSIIVNTVKSYKGEYIGISYVFVGSSRLYNALIGKNLDGSKRVTYVEKENTEFPDNMYNRLEHKETRSWADTVEEDYVEREEIIQPPLVRPKIDVDGEETHYLSISPAFVENCDELTMNTICIKNVPVEISPEILKDVFKNYATTGFTKRKLRFKSGTLMDSYPLVAITNKRRGYITYDPKTNDGIFALLMTKRLFLGDCLLQCSHPPRKTKEYDN